MPGWIEQRTGIVSLSGSLYEYDTHVPMMLLGGSVPAATVERDVTVSSLAPTLAHIMRTTGSRTLPRAQFWTEADSNENKR